VAPGPTGRDGAGERTQARAQGPPRPRRVPLGAAQDEALHQRLVEEHLGTRLDADGDGEVAQFGRGEQQGLGPGRAGGTGLPPRRLRAKAAATGPTEVGEKPSIVSSKRSRMVADH
jgi:hypothetical protein